MSGAAAGGRRLVRRLPGCRLRGCSGLACGQPRTRCSFSGGTANQGCPLWLAEPAHGTRPDRVTSWSRIHLPVYLSAVSDLASGGPGTRICAKTCRFHGWGYVDHPLRARFSRFGTAPERTLPERGARSGAEGALEQVAHRLGYAVLGQRDLLTFRGARHVVGEGVGDGPGRRRAEASSWSRCSASSDRQPWASSSGSSSRATVRARR